MGFGAEEWGRQGATLSDKTACSMHGNPWPRLLRREAGPDKAAEPG